MGAWLVLQEQTPYHTGKIVTAKQKFEWNSEKVNLFFFKLELPIEDGLLSPLYALVNRSNPQRLNPQRLNP